jgi:hypothetical protein
VGTIERASAGSAVGAQTEADTTSLTKPAAFLVRAGVESSWYGVGLLQVINASSASRSG